MTQTAPHRDDIERLMRGLPRERQEEVLAELGREHCAHMEALLAVSPLTFAAVIAAAESAQSMLSNFSVDLGAQGNAIAASAGAQLGLAIGDLKRGVGDKLAQAIDTLGNDIERSARHLSNAVAELRLALEFQLGCIVGELGIFLGQIQTAAETLKRGVWFIRAEAPRVDAARVDGHRGFIIPLAGGRLRLRGFDLWTDDELPPEIAVMNPQRTAVLARLKAEKGAGQDEVTCMISPDALASHVGEIVDIHLRVWRKKHLRKEHYDLYIPVSLPARTVGRFFVKSTIYLGYKRDVPFDFPAEGFYAENHSCSDRKGFEETRVLTTEPNKRIVSCVISPETIDRYVRWAKVSFQERSITVTGELDEPNCTWGHLWSHSVFAQRVVAHGVETVSETIRKEGTSQPVDAVASGETNLMSEFDKLDGLGRPIESPAGDFEFEVWRIMPGGKPELFYKSRRYQFDAKGSESEVIQHSNLILVARCSPGLAAAKGQLSVKITSHSCASS